jgi:hypothetical protein
MVIFYYHKSIKTGFIRSQSGEFSRFEVLVRAYPCIPKRGPGPDAPWRTQTGYCMNRSRNTVSIAILLAVGAILGLAALTWGNYYYTSRNAGGNDFLVHWMGSRALIKDGISPYSDETALRIQNFAYGRPAKAGEHELRVAYPLYSVVLFAPFALIDDFNLARAAWMTLLEVGLVALTFLSLSLVRWRPGPVMLAVLLIFSVFWYHGLRPLINGNAVILVAVGLVGGVLALRAGADELAGVLFAFTTIKPQVVVLVLAFVVVWGVANGRWRLIGWMLGTVLLLTLSAMLIFPDWIVQDLREVIRYPSYNPPGTPGAAFASWWPSFGKRVGFALSGVMGLVLLVEWWAARKADMRGFAWTFCFTLVVSQWIGIQTDPGNFIVLFPALILSLGLISERWKRGAGLVTVSSLLVLLVGLWYLFVVTLQRGDQPVQSPIMFFPLPAFLFVMLYWVRWWAITPPRFRLGQFEP